MQWTRQGIVSFTDICHFLLYNWNSCKAWHSWIYCHVLSSVPVSSLYHRPVPLLKYLSRDQVHVLHVLPSRKKHVLFISIYSQINVALSTSKMSNNEHDKKCCILKQAHKIKTSHLKLLKTKLKAARGSGQHRVVSS